MKSLKQSLLFPKTTCGCGLVTLALALAWPARGADPVLIGQWPGWERGPAYGVAVSGDYAYVADAGAGGFRRSPGVRVAAFPAASAVPAANSEWLPATLHTARARAPR